MKTYIILFILLETYSISAYRMYYVEDECTSQKDKQKVVYNIAANGPNSVGEMRTNRFGTYSRTGRSCVIRLKPPRGYGVVVTVKKVDFRNHELCEDYIKIFTEEDDDDGHKVCRYLNASDDKEGQAFFSSGKMDILYHTENGGFGFHDGFRLIFTVARTAENSECNYENQFKCANSRCIWAGVKCDGHNNCGDFSDESISGIAKCSSVTPITIAVIALSVTTVFALTISICLCCCRARQHAAEKDKLVTDFPSRPNGGYIPLPGYTYSTREPDILPSLYNPYYVRQNDMSAMKLTANLQQHFPQQSALELPPPYKP